MQGAKFTRTAEDFVCGHCGAPVKGSGYTNHCHACLWSKHVDVNPGDRAATCGGLMEPVALEGGSPEYTLVHHCTQCGHTRKNKVATGDNQEALIAIAERGRMRDT